MSALFVVVAVGVWYWTVKGNSRPAGVCYVWLREAKSDTCKTRGWRWSEREGGRGEKREGGEREGKQFSFFISLVGNYFKVLHVYIEGGESRAHVLQGWFLWRLPNIFKSLSHAHHMYSMFKIHVHVHVHMHITCLSHELILQNKVYIFRGLELEKLTDFNARLQSTFPFAKVNEATHTVHVKCILLFLSFFSFWLNLSHLD